ncbi:MAG: hypothetical protein ACR2O2_11980 [Ruegeria sp.]
MHKKFIALIVAAAVTVTGLSVSRAQAADAHDILGGLAAIALLGAAIKRYSTNTRPAHNQNVSRYSDHAYNAPSVQPHRNQTNHIRPLPEAVKRYDLPQRCLKTFDTYSNRRPLLGTNCLNKHYKHAAKLPQACKVGFWNGKQVKHAFEPACLRQKGYRVVY